MGHDARAKKRAEQYLTFVKCRRVVGHKTDRWIVRDAKGEALGCIWFRPQWRQYVLEPYSITFWSADCLDVVSAFLKKANREWREALRG